MYSGAFRSALMKLRCIQPLKNGLSIFFDSARALASSAQIVAVKCLCFPHSPIREATSTESVSTEGASQQARGKQPLTGEHRENSSHVSHAGMRTCVSDEENGVGYSNSIISYTVRHALEQVCEYLCY